MESASKLHTLNKNEEEIYCVNYEEVSNILPISRNDNSQTTGFSLEVEISDSLKQLISFPEEHTSSLLDVTIVRPNHLNGLPGIENAIMKGSEIQNLIACMEKQKRKKEILIEDLRKAQVTKMKHEKKRKPNMKILRNNISVASDSKTMPNAEEKPFANSAPITVFKPLMGQIRESLKNLEERILAVGDHEKHATNTKLLPHSSSNSSDIAVKEGSKRKTTKRHLRKIRDSIRERSHHVYTTVNTFDKLKTLLACQNANAHEVENDKPCLCQHCGMMGLLVESQKRPIMPSLPLQIPPDNGPQAQNRDQESSETSMDDQYYVIRELALRLRDLEERVAFQEQTTVPKEYFKRVVKKILDLQSAISQQNLCGTTAQSAGTQYTFDQYDETHRRNKGKVRQRNVQIQQGYGKRYYVSPIMAESSSQLINNLFLKFNGEKIDNGFLKWGEEFIKPGIDLKSKIVNLLDEKLQHIKLSDSKATSKHDHDRSSSEILKKVLELMSKYVKPGVEISKDEQKMTFGSQISKKNVAGEVLGKDSKRNRSAIPIRIGNTSVGDSCVTTPKNEKRNSLIPKLKVTQTDKGNDMEKINVTCENMVKVTYLNPNVNAWQEVSLNSVAEAHGEIVGVPLRSSSLFQLDYTRSERKPTRLFKNHSLSDKLEFLKRVASSDITKAQLWTYIWNQTKAYCKSKNDTIIIQVPTNGLKRHVGLIEVEFTIEDIRNLAQNPGYLESTRKHSNQSTVKKN